jgi:hypothetical protein
MQAHRSGRAVVVVAVGPPRASTSGLGLTVCFSHGAATVPVAFIQAGHMAKCTKRGSSHALRDMVVAVAMGQSEARSPDQSGERTRHVGVHWRANSIYDDEHEHSHTMGIPLPPASSSK